MLSDLKELPDWQLCGLDLDGCRNPETGECAGWAEQVVDRFDSYSEASPSQTGVRVLFFAQKEDVDALRESGLIRPQADGKPGAGRTFNLPGDHTEIALFSERKFLTITDEVFDGQNQIRPVNLKTLIWLLGDYGSSVQAGEGMSRKDTSGSGEACVSWSSRPEWVALKIRRARLSNLTTVTPESGGAVLTRANRTGLLSAPLTRCRRSGTCMTRS